MRMAFVGCGYVADFYMATLANHAGLELVGVHDRDPARVEAFTRYHGVKDLGSLDAILADESIPILVNLTNPRNHAEVSRRALLAGKHVYSEKPIATEWSHAVELVELAESRVLQIVSAPCTVLGEAAQTLWKAVRDGRIGPVRLVYAEQDEGLIHKEKIKTWRSASGSPWPYKDEFEVGCTLEHAGYYVTWLAAMFGPAVSVTSFASCQLPDKAPGENLEPDDTPDFSCGCIRFESGVVARVTCGIIAPHDHTMRLIGDAGELKLYECWDFGSRIDIHPWTRWSFRAHKYPLLARLVGLGPKRLRLARKPSFKTDGPGANPIDFCRGVAELAGSIEEGRPCRLSPRFSLHVNEIVLALQNPGTMGSPRTMTTTFEPVEPMPWAR